MALTVKARKWIKTLSEKDFALAQVLLNFAQQVRDQRSQDNIVEETKESLAEIKRLFEVNK